MKKSIFTLLLMLAVAFANSQTKTAKFNNEVTFIRVPAGVSMSCMANGQYTLTQTPTRASLSLNVSLQPFEKKYIYNELGRRLYNSDGTPKTKIQNMHSLFKHFAELTVEYLNDKPIKINYSGNVLSSGFPEVLDKVSGQYTDGIASGIWKINDKTIVFKNGMLDPNDPISKFAYPQNPYSVKEEGKELFYSYFMGGINDDELLKYGYKADTVNLFNFDSDFMRNENLSPDINLGRIITLITASKPDYVPLIKKRFNTDYHSDMRYNADSLKAFRNEVALKLPEDNLADFDKFITKVEISTKRLEELRAQYNKIRAVKPEIRSFDNSYDTTMIKEMIGIYNLQIRSDQRKKEIAERQKTFDSEKEVFNELHKKVVDKYKTSVSYCYKVYTDYVSINTRSTEGIADATIVAEYLLNLKAVKRFIVDQEIEKNYSSWNALLRKAKEAKK